MRRLVVVTILSACSHVAQTPIRNLDTSDPNTLVQIADTALSESVRLDYRRPFEGAPIDRSSVRVAYRRACDAGSHRACWIISQIGDRTSRSIDRSRHANVVANCVAGDILSCRSIDLFLPAGVACSYACRERDLERDCTKGFPDSCKELLTRRPTDRILARRMVELYREGCDAYIAQECLDLGLSKEPEVRDVDRDAAWSRACEVQLFLCIHIAPPLRVLTTPRAHDDAERICQYGHDPVADCVATTLAYLTHERPEPVARRVEKLQAMICHEFPTSVVCPDSPLFIGRSP